MALELHISPCIRTPARDLHPPPSERPLRIQIEGPLVSIQKLFPAIPWHTDVHPVPYPQPAGPELAALTYKHLYGREARADVFGDIVVRDEYLGWVMDERPLR